MDPILNINSSFQLTKKYNKTNLNRPKSEIPANEKNGKKKDEHIRIHQSEDDGTRCLVALMK